jgi:molybdenum cofactor biosynthesis enzyme MoaA
MERKYDRLEWLAWIGMRHHCLLQENGRSATTGMDHLSGSWQRFREVVKRKTPTTTTNKKTNQSNNYLNPNSGQSSAKRMSCLGSLK